MSRESNIDNLFNESACLSLLAIERYRVRLLDNDEKTLVENHLKECPLCADAVEGLSMLRDGSDLTSFTSSINTGLRKRFNYTISRRRAETRAPQLRQLWVPAAASIIILVGLIAYFHYFFPEQHDLAMLDEKESVAIPVEKREMADQNKMAEIPAEEQSVPKGKGTEGIGSAKDESPSDEKDENARAVIGGISAPVTKQATSNTIDAAEGENNPVVVADTEIVFVEPVLELEGEEIAVMEFTEEVVVTSDEVPAASEDINQYAEGKQARVVQGDKATQKSLARPQKGNLDKTESPIFTVVEQMPEFPGGVDSLNKFLHANLVFPKSPDSSINKTVYLTFIINDDGSIRDIQILRSAGEMYDKEAVRVIKMMPAWIPGKQRDVPVRVQYNLAVSFIKE